MFSKCASSPAQRAVNAGSPNAAENPTEGQKRVGNYQKVHLNLDGFRISIENPKGSYRSGTAPDGTKWRNMLACDYGDIRGTEDVDGDPVDIYLSDHPDKGAVFVIDQIDPKTKQFDEHKVMYGFDSVEDAKKTYLACYQDGWKGLGWITPVTKAEFRKWIDSSTRKGKPFHEYKSVTPIVDPIKVAQAKPQDDPYEGVPAGVKLRSFIDAPATRTAIMDNVLDAVKNRFPVEDDDVRLELRDLKYEGPTSYTLEQQKNALLGNRRLGCSIAGTWRLTDKRTGQVLDERRDGVIRVPYYTDRGTIINNGNEYTVISQARLSPGVYVRRKQNGELESQFNVANGLGFRIGLNRETGALNMSVGQGHIPLYPVLRSMGVSDEDIRKSWGNEVALVNVGQTDPRALDKIYARYAGRKADMNLSDSDKAKFVNEALAGSKLDPSVVVRTLGLENVEGVTGPVILRAAQKLLNINRGAEDPDERDNPRFSKFYGVEDMMRERIDKDAGRLSKSILFRAKRDKSLARIGRNALAPYLDTFLSGSGLAMPGEEANPLSILTQQSRITRLGEGGISSPDLVTPEARNVQGDYLGYVDFISGPESFGIGIDVRAALGTMKGSDNRLYNKMMDLHTGKTRYIALDDAASHTVAFPGQDPNAPKLYAMRKGVPTMVSRDEVDYMVPGFGNTVSAGINMTPMPTAVQAGRQFYMSKFWEQYLPQKEGEVPLVDSLMDDGKTTYSEFYGRKVGCLTSPFAGIVIKSSDKEITVRGKDGQTHTVSLVQGLPFNRMTSITYIPQVKKGDEIPEGGILANSNFTDAKTGAMNMGRNLKVAVLPAPVGVSSYEDAIVISESAAKKLATSRTYGFEQDTKEGVQVQRNKYLAAFPKAYTKQQADTIDANGVVKVGTVLHRDDPMILAIGPKMLSAEDAQLGRLSSVLRNALTDKSQKWEHDWPGVVTDVVAGAHGVKVLVKSEPPVKVGDKVSPENGLKGVVGGILPDDKMPRDAATNETYDMLMNPMGFLSRVAPGQVMLMNLAKVAKKTGKQIRIPQMPPPEGWLAWTEKQMSDNGVKETADVFDPQTGRTIRDVGDGYVYVKAFHHLAEKKYSARGVEGSYTQDEQPSKGGEDGAKRMCFTADQSIRVIHGEETIGHIVDKRIPEYVWTRFDDGSWGYSLVTNWFCRKGKMNEVLSIGVMGLPGSDNCSRKRVVYTYKTLHVTKQHHVFSPDRGEILAGELKPGDWLTSYGYVPTEDQMSILIGSMLGDGCICNVNDNIRKMSESGELQALPFYQEQHSHHQYAYVNWKVHSLGALVSSRKSTQGKSKSGFGYEEGLRVAYFQIHRHDIAEILKNMFYRQKDGSLGKKNLDNVDLSIINDAGIVAWFLDDGCIGEHKKCGIPTGSPFGSISTLGFTKEENEKLAKWLAERLGADVHVQKLHKRIGEEVKYYYGLYLSADACRSMARLVAKYISPDEIPPSKKWLISEVRKLGHLYVGVNNSYKLGSVPVLVTSVKPYNDGKHKPDDEICLYDITVDRSHKYCASDCLVSNSGFDNLALLSHGATEVIKDSMTIRGQMNDEYWRSYRLGLPVEEPGVPFIYQKFINTLKAGGVNVVEKGDVTSLMPQTDADIDEMAQGRVIESSQMVDADMNPVKGGLFDLGTTGGMGGNRWSMIMLPESVPNPMMEEPVRRVLGLTTKKMEAILSGREELNGKTGGEAIKDALKNLDVDEEISRARVEIQNRRGSQRDNAIKVLGYLKSAKEMGKKPEDWMISRIPVLPPMFRPVARMGDVALVPDMNELYKELIEMKRNYEDLSKELPASALADERLAVYGAVKAAYGLGNPITAEGQAKNLKGAIRQVIGTVPKCYDSETELLTERGWIKFGDVNENDVVATVNPTTLKLEWQIPSDVIHSEYNGLMVHTKSNKIDLLVTPNHNHFVQTRVGSLSDKYKKGKSEWNDWRKIDAAEMMYCGARMHMLTAPCGYDGDGCPDFPDVKNKMAFAFICGMYIAEGWDSVYSANICQTSANSEICELMRKKFSESGIKHKETTFNKKNGKKITYWSIYSRDAANWFRDNFGHLAGGKRISKRVLEWKAEYLKELLDGYLYGDGCKEHGRKSPSTNKTFYNKDPMTCEHSRANTTSFELVNCMSELCMKIGLGFRMTDVIHSANPKWNVQYRFRIDGWNKVIIEGRKFHSWEMYNGKVHCVTVPNGLVIVRRNGFTAVSGNSGMFQSKVISKTQDNVGRSVTIPDKNLDMDQIGIPEEMAWTMYKPHVERKLIQRGYSPIDAKKMIEEKNATARHILDDAMAERPILMDRAPTWHKFNIMAFRPHIVEGRSIHVCPLIDSGYNMDHDGNCVDYDSIITVRMSKSAFDNAREICDNMLHVNQEKEHAMTNENASVRIIDPDQIEMTVKIGTFPRMGIPELDKNGARMYQVPEGIKVLSVDPVTGEKSFEPVTMFTHELECDTVKVSYGSKSVIVSSNESLAVFDGKEGRLVRVKPCAEEKRMTPVLVSSSEVFGSFGDRDLGWLFGSYISDGWSSDRMVGYTKVEDIKRSEFVRILRKNHENFNLYEYAEKKNEKKLGNSVKIHCNSASLANWIHQWKFVHDDICMANGRRTALYKMIDPKLIESGSSEFLWGLLSGLIDGDGSVVCNTSKKNPRFTFRINTSSPYLRDDVCRLCHKLGLRYSITVVKARGWSNESYVISPSTVDMFSNIERLSCIGSSERSIIEQMKQAGRVPEDRTDMIPVSDEELSEMRSMSSFKTGSPMYVTLFRTRKDGAMRASRSHLMEMIDQLSSNEKTAGLAGRVLAKNTKWMQITSVEDAGKREVFDLEVATTKTFVINDGVVVWDTVNLHVPASMKAANQAFEKMLPSKNLFSLTDMKSMRYKPEKEQISGLWALTRGKTRKPVRIFRTKSEATAAYRNGEIGPNDPVEIQEMV